MNSPHLVRISRSKKRAPINDRRRSIRQVSREYFRSEGIWSFVVELFLFGLLAAISVWPMLCAVEALRLL
jgi:hypothetical protein